MTAPAAASPADARDRASARPGFDVWLDALTAAPHRYDFYQVLRHIEAAHPSLPRLGEALRPADEPVRLTQPAELTFAPASIHGVQRESDGTPRVRQRIFGLLGPNGPLPLHLTELARDRANQHADAGLQRFLDTLSHRFGLLFYRAWAQAQPVLGLDRPGKDPFALRLGALFGVGNETATARDALGDPAKLHFTGRLARQVRDADGLLAWCRAEFGVPVRVDQWCGHWMPLGRDERTRLKRGQNHALGHGAVLGQTVWDVQHKFRIVIGPLRLARYLDFLPGGRDLSRLQAMVRQWVGLEFAWDLQLILARQDVPRLRLGGGGLQGRLGRSGWLGRYARPHDAVDLVIDVEATLQRRRPAGAAPAAPAGP
jgi:type VI secretion system protein ImpH